ncbi:rod shape-determining protein [bacterium]|nr:rod shape-determining protein [bacterium]
MLDFFDKLVAGFSPDLGLDLGTSYVGMLECNRGKWREPACLAYEGTPRQLLTLGEKAKIIEGRCEETCKIVHPITNGFIYDYDGVLELIRLCFAKCTRLGLLGPRVMVAVPVGSSETDWQVYTDLCKAAGARSVFVVPSILASAMGAGLDVSGSKTCFVLDIGAGVSQAAMICMGGIVAADCVPIAGDSFDESIINYCRQEKDLIVGKESAERLKTSGGCAWTDKAEEEFVVKGRDLKSGLPRAIKLTSGELCNILSSDLQIIVNMLERLLQITPPSFVADVAENGLWLCGGGSLLKGLEQFLAYKLSLLCVKVAEPKLCSLNGLEKMFYNPKIMYTISSDSLNRAVSSF